MELSDFLAAVVPPGVIVVGRRVQRQRENGELYWTVAHTCSRTHSDAVRTIEHLSAGHEDVYYALASFKQGFHPNPQTNKKQLRVRSNVASLQALWFDIDFKGAYPDAKTAVLALRAFSQATAVPAPALLVGSGNGLHAYWPLTAPVPLERWQRLADALKQAAKAQGLGADLACTADSCRVLRPPGTTNWKDPSNPKPVRLLYGSGKTYEYDEMEAALAPWFEAKRTFTLPTHSSNSELTGGLGTREVVLSSFAEVIKHCGVLKHVSEAHGADSIEPEWMATLQLLKHCEDGEMWVHPVSDGHPGYTPSATDRKWEQRKANTAGPTLCSTFEGYRPAICAKCPHNGFIKTPLQLGVEGTQAIEGLPTGWRVAPNKRGVERMMITDAGEGKTEKEWVRVLRYIPMNLRATRSIVTGRYELLFDVEMQNSKPWAATLPGGVLGNVRKLCEVMADSGLIFKGRESKDFVDLMSTWLEKLQAARRVADVTEQLGWLSDEEKLIGFSTGPTTYYTDGRVRNDVRASREFSAISRFYEARGGLEPWKHVARFIAEQNNPAFTAILASAFGSPLLRFTGLSGGILAIVSTASGVGKSSALKCSQAVWGSPTHGVNAVDDTPKSVARKLGFLNNLPAFWDELRGRKTVEDFLTLAFQITQGKEKSRLDSSAQLREASTWETMLIVASNESIFDAMGRGTQGSDAGVVRTFEIFVEPFAMDRNRAEIALMFEKLNTNYGHAGRVYAQYLATHAVEVQTRVQDTFTALARAGKMDAQERFWFAIMAALIVGAELAEKLDLVQIDRRRLLKFLMQTLQRLRGRSGEALHTTDPAEVLAAFMQSYQDRGLTVDRFPAPRQNTTSYVPEIVGGAPRADKIVYHVSRDERLLRVPLNEFMRWAEHRGLPAFTILKRLTNEGEAKQVRCRLGIGTKWELPPQRCLQLSLDVVGRATAGDSSRPDDSPDSSPDSAPAG